MPIDASIPLQIRPPQIDDPATVQAKQLQLRDLMGQQQMRQMQMEDAQRSRSDEMTLADLYRQTGGDAGKIREGLAQRGLGARIPAFDKGQAELQKTQGEAELQKFKVMKEKTDATAAGLSSLLANPNVTHDQVIGMMTQLVQRGVWTPQEGAAAVQTLPGRPEMLRQFLMQKGMEAMDASKRIDMMLPKTEVRNMGGADQVFRTNQLTGEVTPGQQFGKTMTPGEVASNQIAQQQLGISGGNLAVAREGLGLRRQELEAGKLPAGYRRTAGGDLEPIPGGPADPTQKQAQANAKPMPAPAVKLQNEELSALGTFKGLDSDLAELQKQLGSGALKVGPISNLVQRGKNFVGASDEQSRNLATLRSKLENMRNSVLLLNKGVQTEGDAQRAMNEIIENINDPGVLAQRLAEVRALNARAAELRKSNVDLLRSNYGHEPMDYGKYENQPAAVNLAPAAPKPGAVDGGYVFRGGDPSDPKNWSKK